MPLRYFEEKRPLEFMVIDMDYGSKNYDQDDDNAIRMFGTTAEGLTVLALIRNFYPYLYTQIPADTTMKSGDEYNIKQIIQSRINKGEIIRRIDVVTKYSAFPYE